VSITATIVFPISGKKSIYVAFVSQKNQIAQEFIQTKMKKIDVCHHPVLKMKQE